ncbi:MAG TPA: sigma-70 family RNA polymerase sigma factor [Clostridia bacterium]|nr:sigma-70 family RNA polymerase sigma factor [Clostridia bacterium]
MEQGRARIGEVFATEAARFLRFVERQLFGGSTAEAEDIVSDVAYNLLRRADVIEEVENLTAYIYRSLANRVTDLRRQSVAMVPLDAPNDEGGAAMELASSGRGPESAALHSELREQLGRALGELNPKERAVWIATEIDGRSFRDLADEWEEPIGTLLSRKSRATATLRKLLSAYRSQ